jgi:hypothetical protein
MYIRLFEICFHFAGHTFSAQEFSAGPSEFLPDLHFVCKIVLNPSNVIPFTPLLVVMAEYIAKGDNRFRSLP